MLAGPRVRPHAHGATTRHREAEGSSYYRHFYMGLIRAADAIDAARGARSAPGAEQKED